MPVTNDDLLTVANLLALPRSLPAAQTQATRQRALYQPLVAQGILTEEQLQALAPNAPFGGQLPGSDVPILGGFLRGVGTVGQLMQSVLGGAPAAPRPPVSEIAAIAQLQETARRSKASSAAAESFKDPQARVLAQAGQFGAASRAEHPSVGSERSAFMQEHPGASLDDYERWKRSFKPAASGGTADPKTDLMMWRKDHPQGTWADYQKDKAGAAAGATTARSTAAADVKEKYAHLPVAAQNTMGSIYTLRGVANDLLGLLSDPQVRADRGLWEGRGRQLLYEAGLATGPNEDMYIALSNFSSILGVQPFMRGTKNMIYIGQIQQHLPKPGDQPELVEAKIHRILKNVDLLEAGIRQAASMRVNAPPPTASGTTPSAPTTGTQQTPGGNTYRVVEP